MSYTDNFTYNNDLITEVFGSLCIDKTRLPSSGLTSWLKNGLLW